MPSEENFLAVIDRAKRAFGVDSDTAMATLLGMKQAAFSNRKASGSIPYQELIAAAGLAGVDLNWLLTGEPTTRNVMEQPAAYVVDEVQRVLSGLTPEDCASVLAVARRMDRLEKLERRVAALEAGRGDATFSTQTQTIHGNVGAIAGRDIRRGK